MKTTSTGYIGWIQELQERRWVQNEHFTQQSTKGLSHDPLPPEWSVDAPFYNALK